MHMDWLGKWELIDINNVNRINIEDDKWVVYRLGKVEYVKEKFIGTVTLSHITHRLGRSLAQNIKSVLEEDMRTPRDCDYFILYICDSEEEAFDMECAVYKKMKNDLWEPKPPVFKGTTCEG